MTLSHLFFLCTKLPLFLVVVAFSEFCLALACVYCSSEVCCGEIEADFIGVHSRVLWAELKTSSVVLLETFHGTPLPLTYPWSEG